MCANSWVDNWVRTAQNRRQNTVPLVLLLPLVVLITGMVKGKRQKPQFRATNVPINSTLYLMDVSDGTAARSLCNHSGLATLSFTTLFCLTNVGTSQPSHTHKRALRRVCESAWDGLECWCESSKTARQRGRKGTAMSSPSDRISQSNSVDPRLLLRLTLHWAVSLPWREWWMDSLFILTPF